MRRLIGWLRGFRAARAGAMAAEFAIVIPVLLLFCFAIIEFGRAMWIRNAMQSAVEEAARCYALNRPSCDTTAKVQSYAVAAAVGVPVASSAFTPSTAACGKQVTGAYNFTSIVPMVPLNVTIQAKACRPAPP